MNFILPYFSLFFTAFWLAGWIYTWVIGTNDMKWWERIIAIPISFLWPIFLIRGYVNAKKKPVSTEGAKQ